MSAHPGYETHPAPEVLPLEGEAFDALVADIRGNGLITPNILIDGRMVLDCRNRIRVCIAGGPRSKDPFVVLFVGDNRSDLHASCHAAWLAEREAEACKALGLEPRPGGHARASRTSAG